MPTSLEDANRHACPRCGSPREQGQQVCRICNWPYANKPAADGMAALRALRRQLEVFGQQGLLDADARAQLNLAINEQEQRLLLAAPKADAPLAEVVDQTATIDSHPVAASTFAPLEGEPELAPVIEAQSSLTTSERAKLRSQPQCRDIRSAGGAGGPSRAAEAARSTVADFCRVHGREEHPLGRTGGWTVDRRVLDRTGDQLLGGRLPRSRCSSSYCLTA